MRKHAGAWLAAGCVITLIAVGQLWPSVAQARRRGTPAPSSQTASERSSEWEPLAPVRLDGNYFARNGKRFLPVGAHWVPAKAAMQWPLQWDPKDIEADFAKMHDLGFNTVRLDLMWAWFEPRPGDFNPEAFQQLDYLVSLARRYHIYLHPSLFIGGEVGEAYWDVSWRHGRNPQSDPEMLWLETNHAAQLARRYAGESAIIGWDLTDEPPFWIVQGTTDAMAINWTRLIAGAIRRYDHLHPIVVGVSMEDVGHGPFRPDNLRDEVDFFSVHPYTIYAPQLFPDAMLSERGTYGAALETALSSSAGRPTMIQEMGASSAQYTPEAVAAFDRVSMYSSLGAGANAFLLWCFTDAAPQQYRKVPYLRSPHETQFGLTTWDRKDRPQGVEFRKFSQIAAQLDLNGIEPAAAEAGIIVPNEWAKPHGDFSRFGLTGPEAIPYVSTDEGMAVAGQQPPNLSDDNNWLTGAWLSSFVLAHRAGLKADFPREYSDWQKRPLLLLPSPLTSTDAFLVHVHTDFWEKAREYVSQGGALYASVSADAAIPEMEQLFGARLVDHVPVSDVKLKVVAPFGDLKPGEIFHYPSVPNDPRHWAAILRVNGGTVIAVDQDGRPALVANTVGKGKTLLCAYPLESYLAAVPGAFDRPESTHRIYKAFADWAGVRPVFSSDQPSVEVRALNGQGRGYVVLANHTAGAQKVRLSTTLPLKSLRQVTPAGLAPIPLQGSSWTMDLEPYGGAVVEWR